MAINILELLVKKQNATALEKADPNTQALKEEDYTSEELLQIQAIAPASIAGIYDASRSEEGINFLEGNNTSGNYIELLFGGNAAIVLQNITTFTNSSKATIISRFNEYASEAIAILREKANKDDIRNSIRQIAGDQKPFFAPFLPAELQIGKLLEDETLDDRTNKMEGPISSLIHKMSSFFSGQESKEEADKVKNDKM